MANLRCGTLGLLVSALAFAGCTGASDAATSGAERAEHEALAQRFGQHIVNGDWAAAYGMTTSQFQEAVSQAQLQAAHDDLVRQMREDEPGFSANTVQVDFGVLPANEEEARQTYDITVVPPRDTWKAWLAAGVGSGDGTTIERGVDAWLLIVEQSGQLKIGHVNFEFID
jgi:ABC-type glycerol-3-phosphate transport system substrate-binding protein